MAPARLTAGRAHAARRRPWGPHIHTHKDISAHPCTNRFAARSRLGHVVSELSAQPRGKRIFRPSPSPPKQCCSEMGSRPGRGSNAGRCQHCFRGEGLGRKILFPRGGAILRVLRVLSVRPLLRACPSAARVPLHACARAWVPCPLPTSALGSAAAWPC